MSPTYLHVAALLCALGCREAPASPSWTPLGPGVTVHRSDRRDSTNHVVTWIVARVDLRRATVRAERPPGNRLEALGHEQTALFAVNAGFFEPDATPSGLLVIDGVARSPWQARGGSGVLVVSNGVAGVVVSPPATFAGVSLAIQCGPRLVEPRGVPGIRSDDGKHAARTVACVRNGGRALDFVVAYYPETTMGGPTLFDMAQWLAKPLAPGDPDPCEEALNFDGGPSTGFVSARLSEASWKHPAGIVPWAVGATKTE